MGTLKNVSTSKTSGIMECIYLFIYLNKLEVILNNILKQVLKTKLSLWSLWILLWRMLGGLRAKKVENHCSRVGLRHVDLNTFGGISLTVYCIFMDCTSTCSTGWVAGLTWVLRLTVVTAHLTTLLTSVPHQTERDSHFSLQWKDFLKATFCHEIQIFY